MSRVKGGFTRKRKHKEVRERAKGFVGYRGRTIKGAKEGILHAEHHAFESRRLKKRDMRSLWITRINAVLKSKGLSYSNFSRMLRIKNVVLNRKVMNDLAINDPQTLEVVIDRVFQE